MTSVFLLAGEASGDRIGAALIEGLRAQRPDIDFFGIGGEAMSGPGLASIFPMEDLAVMGYRDVILRLPLLLLRARQTVNAILKLSPEAVVLIDAQVFSKVVAQSLRRRGYRGAILLYVAPAVWAWGPERARKLAKIFDEVLSVLPFEPTEMARLGGPRTAYVGHPAVRQYPMRAVQPQSGPVLLLPGSRTGEIRRHMPMFKALAARLKHHPSVTGFSILSTRAQARRIAEEVATWDVDVAVAAQDKQDQLAKAVAAVAVSGTVTLELALSGVPHILTYVAEGAQVRMFEKATTAFIGLPNIIARAPVVPEVLFAHKGDAGRLADEAVGLLDDPQARARQIEAFGHIRALMEKGAPEAPLQDPVQRILAHLPRV